MDTSHASQGTVPATRLVHCVKLKKEGPGLASPPFPGETGQRIFEQVSVEAWRLWLNQQTMLINEYRLNLLDPKARTYLQQAAADFFFNDTETTPPPGYQPPAS